MFANRLDIRRVSPDGSDYDAIIGNLENAIALDYHYAKGILFWSDVNLDRIYKVKRNLTITDV